MTNFFESCKVIRENLERIRAIEKQKKKGIPNNKKKLRK